MKCEHSTFIGHKVVRLQVVWMYVHGYSGLDKLIALTT
jgi:hypothetical protein